MKIKRRPTDILFSKYIRKRDNYTCQRCGKMYSDGGKGLHCSHYHSRSHENTRFDPENCIALCFGCHHLWGGDLKDDYTAFMKEKLGDKAFDYLRIRANTYKKKDNSLDMLGIKELMKEV
jgi:5-methylcytosine-specific restriction endonuclease McrA